MDYLAEYVSLLRLEENMLIWQIVEHKVHDFDT
jgi:hypothetical protein